jgi:hypothetical protein
MLQHWEAKRHKYAGVGAKNRKVGKARTYRRQVRSLTAHNWHISHASQYKVQLFIVAFYGVKASDIKQYGKTLMSKQWCQFHNPECQRHMHPNGAGHTAIDLPTPYQLLESNPADSTPAPRSSPSFRLHLHHRLQVSSYYFLRLWILTLKLPVLWLSS